MEIGKKMIVGRMGQQPLTITDQTVEIQHVSITRLEDNDYLIEDLESKSGTFVFGLKIKRKHVKAETPFMLGSYKTTVKQLLTNSDDIDLESIWKKYESEKHKWDRYGAMVNSIRMLVPVLTLIISQLIGQNWMVSVSILVIVSGIAIFAGEKVMDKRTLKMSELNTQMQSLYVCKHCHRFLGFVPYKALLNSKYCPHCGVPVE